MSKTSIEYSNARDLHHYTFNGETMGTRYSAQCYAGADVDRALLADELDRAVQAVDREMSNWKACSDLSRLNLAEPGVWVPISANLAAVLARAIEIGRESGNAFNVDMGDVVSRWGFGPRDADISDTPSALSAGPRRPADELLEVDAIRCRARKRASVALDLCGIAKGFGVDELGRVMNRHGIQSWLVGIDGEMRARGTKPSGAFWAIAIERPQYERREPLCVIEITDIAIATSGDYRHWCEYDGQRVSHTMDPRTGAPLSNGVASVTVLASNCMDADAYATALMVLGAEEGLELARRKQLDALFLVREREGLRAVGIGCFAER
ncbi:FAD:protein FMN transferase [Ralstonia sp. UBA689]|uniref:FAD:protein FMN transferase n=1 Tax=Ralstonia sp. UBA689 TaxID=1947373 RepID=UPI0025F9287C|nr:FAD:protein FMN transferase [Ralstonia sp. UBA689]